MSNDITNASAPARQGTAGSASEGRRPWCLPTLKDVGHVGDVLQGGGGKLSPIFNDPGDTRKPPGGG